MGGDGNGPASATSEEGEPRSSEGEEARIMREMRLRCELMRD